MINLKYVFVALNRFMSISKFTFCWICAEIIVMMEIVLTGFIMAMISCFKPLPTKYITSKLCSFSSYFKAAAVLTKSF